MQVCTSLQTDNHASTRPLSFLQARCPSCRRTNSVKTLKANIITLSNYMITTVRNCRSAVMDRWDGVAAHAATRHSTSSILQHANCPHPGPSMVWTRPRCGQSVSCATCSCWTSWRAIASPTPLSHRSPVFSDTHFTFFQLTRQKVISKSLVLAHVCVFNGPFLGLPRRASTGKVKTNLDLTVARDNEWQWHQLGHMQFCTSLQADNHTSTPPLSFYMLDALPAIQPTASKH